MMKFKKPITRDIFFQVLDKVGLPTDMAEFLKVGDACLYGSATDVYRNKVGGYLRTLGVETAARSNFMDTLQKRIYNDVKLFSHMFAYEDPQELFAVLLLAAGSTPPNSDTWARTKQQIADHAMAVKAQLRELRAPTCTLSAEQFESCVEFKAEQFNVWCKKGGTFGVDSNAESKVEG